MGGRGSSRVSGGSVLYGEKILSTLKETQQITAKQYTDAQSGHNEMMNLYKDWGEKQLSGTERLGIKHYQGAAYGSINRYLRAKENGQDPNQLPSSYKEHMTNITEALNKASVPHDMVVWRGVGSGENNANIFNEAEIKTMVATKKYFDGGFMSTSINETIGRTWAGKPDGFGGKTETAGYHGYTLRIELPKGAKAGYVEAATHSQLNEYEMLVQRNSRYSITGYKLEDRMPGHPSYGKIWVISMRYEGLRKSKVQ